MMLIDGKSAMPARFCLKEGVTNLAPLPKNPDPGYCTREIAPPDERLDPDDGLD